MANALTSAAKASGLFAAMRQGSVMAFTCTHTTAPTCWPCAVTRARRSLRAELAKVPAA